MANHRLVTLIWIFTEKFGLIFLSMITFVVYARLLSPAELGVGTVIIAIVELIGLIYSSVLEDPLVRAAFAAFPGAEIIDDVPISGQAKKSWSKRA